MPTNGTEDRSGREIRLLLLVIAVAVAGLLVLARFRFPEAEIVRVSPTPNPLERLTTRAPFDDLAASVAEGAGRIAPWLAVLELERLPEKAPKKPRAEGPAEPQRTLVPALRVRLDVVVAYAPAGLAATTLAGVPVQSLGADPLREIGLFGPAGARGEQGGSNPGVVDFASAVSGFSGSTYVLAAEAAAGAPTVRPVFVPRVDPVAVEHWPMPLMQIGGDPQLRAGTFLFTMDGRAIGLVVPLPAGVAIVDAAMLDRLVVELTGNRQ